MSTLINLFSVLVPWIAAGIVVPLLLYAVRAAVCLVGIVSNSRRQYRNRRFFQQYTQRGYY